MAATESTAETRVWSASTQREMPTIYPAERLMLVRENAWVRAQKRGFVGGDPVTDWTEAQKEIDAKYGTDNCGLFSLTAPAEISERSIAWTPFAV